ncbi:DNA excision repair protein ERCC-6-like [Coregonus clupeaformis]|uniref:DNA excision repair protein ERCC-6-like n=1 Tax=Coregonus clupeaformis TaxID=59861 RepID=UPI001BE0722F|nr:DNA excision repair protein ERCC-6-like [Coregonus clupeaformis]
MWRDSVGVAHSKHRRSPNATQLKQSTQNERASKTMEDSKHRIAEMSEKLEKSLSMDTEEMETYQRYIKDGKDAARQGNMSKSLELFKLAHDIHPSDKLRSRIKKLQEAIKEMTQQGSESEDEDFVNVNNSGLMLFKEMYDKLYDHQQEGVAFLYGLHRDGHKGGILADDMGLGKTIQVISFLSGMYDADLVKHTLLVMPTSLIKNWTKEFAKWTPGMRVKEFHGTSKVERNRNLEKIQRRGGVIITTYQMLITNWELLSSLNGREFKWDYVILDEAHKIKTSSTKTAKSAHAIPARNRVLLTGTPVQNNLREMWALFDFACQGALLGTSKTFKTEYENPITRAREKDATPGEKALGLKMSQNLMAIINPYFLRRTKAEVQRKTQNREKDLESEDLENKVPSGGGAEMPNLTRKNDLIIWTYLSSVQEEIYNQFLSLDNIKELLMTTRSPLAELNILKKLCDHPRLLSARAVAQLGLEEGTSANHQDDENESAAHRIDNISDEMLISESGKLMFLIALLERLKEEGHRTLVFSQSRKMLDILERVLVNKRFKIVRIDGTVTHLTERERRIQLFQTNKQYSVFLLTTQVGGVGITLTAANRVVIFDPSWNPATDAQAVDRAYRIGQTENVVIYRLITCGTVEEKIYRRQVFKDSLIRQTTGDKKNPFRYFSKQDLKELFTLQDTRSSSTQLQLQLLHSRQRRTDPKLDEHIAHLHSMEMFGISDHDLMFSHEVENNEDDPEDQEAHKYIENRVQKAQELMKAESKLHQQFAESIESNTEPAHLRKPPQHNTMGSTEKKPKDEKPSPSYPSHNHNFNNYPVLVDLTQSGSGDEEDIHNLSNKFIDLAVDESIGIIGPTVTIATEEQFIKSNHHSPVDKSLEVLLDGEPIYTSAQEILDVSSEAKDDIVAVEYITSLVYVTSEDEQDKQPNGNGSPQWQNLSLHQDLTMDQKISPVKSLKNQRRSMLLQMSNKSLESNAETSSKADDELESFEGNFNLQLDDSASDMFPEEESESVVGNSGFQLEMDVSLNADDKPSVSVNGAVEQNGAGVHDVNSPVSEADDTVENSFITSFKKKKRAALIYDSEENDIDEDERPHLMTRKLDEEFHGIGSSTPKSVKSGSISFKARKSFGGNTSVASRRSFVDSVIEDVEDLDEDMEAEVSQVHTDDASEESEVTGSCEAIEVTGFHESLMEEEEPTGETLNTENEEESEEGGSEPMHAAEESELGEEEESYLEESTCDHELASSERMDQCTRVKDATLQTVEGNNNNSSDSAVTGEKMYENLVKKGKQSYSEGKLDDALNFFLKAIDIRSGDTEIQLMTIKLYRQLSEKMK